MNKLKGPGFYIAQRYGGPALSYSLYPQRTEEDRSVLGRGTISYYPFFYSAAVPQQLKPLDALKTFYLQAVRFMKQGASQIKGKRRSVWVAQDGVALLVSGRASAPEPWDKSVGTVE